MNPTREEIFRAYQERKSHTVQCCQCAVVLGWSEQTTKAVWCIKCAHTNGKVDEWWPL